MWLLKITGEKLPPSQRSVWFVSLNSSSHLCFWFNLCELPLAEQGRAGYILHVVTFPEWHCISTLCIYITWLGLIFSFMYKFTLQYLRRVECQLYVFTLPEKGWISALCIYNTWAELQWKLKWHYAQMPNKFIVNIKRTL